MHTRGLHQPLVPAAVTERADLFSRGVASLVVGRNAAAAVGAITCALTFLLGILSEMLSGHLRYCLGILSEMISGMLSEMLSGLCPHFVVQPLPLCSIAATRECIAPARAYRRCLCMFV